MDTSKERSQEDMVKDAVLHHNIRGLMGNRRMVRSVEGTSRFQESHKRKRIIKKIHIT